MDLFSHSAQFDPKSMAGRPLADQLRPTRLDDFVGQDQVVGPHSALSRMLKAGHIPSLILWGPPGCGKTTLAQLIAHQIKAEFVARNAIDTGAKVLRELGLEAHQRRLERQEQTLLFIDEIHRLNKGQQDVLLPHIENGDLTLIGATTENPSYELNAALLSRCRLVVFDKLSESALHRLLIRAFEAAQINLGRVLTPESQTALIAQSDGDGRRLLNAAEQILDLYQLSAKVSDTLNASGPSQETHPAQETLGLGTQAIPLEPRTLSPAHQAQPPLNSGALPSASQLDTSTQLNTDDHANTNSQPPTNQRSPGESIAADPGSTIQWPLTPEHLTVYVGERALYYDRDRDQHYDTISAFIKSIRGSDPDAGLYYLARMLKGGEDPLFIARRLVILASEDVGNADPRALSVAVAGAQAVELIGLPEAAINLAQVVTYLASAPKSNRSYEGLKKAQQEVDTSGLLPIPLSLRSAKTKAMKDLGYGRDYKYSHEGPTGWLEQQFLPDAIAGKPFYQPVDRGFEKTMRQYLDWVKGQRQEKKGLGTSEPES